jgi:hypothetical protein
MKIPNLIKIGILVLLMFAWAGPQSEAGGTPCPYDGTEAMKKKSFESKPCNTCHARTEEEIANAAHEPPKLLSPPTIRHLPPESGIIGENLEINATFTNPELIKEARLYYKTLSTQRFLAVEMAKFPQQRYRGVIPEDQTKCLWVSYYFTVVDQYGRRTDYFQRAKKPWSVRLEKQEETTYGYYLAAGGITLSPIFLALIILKLKTYRERRKIGDQVFWVQTLLPHLGLSGFELNEQLSSLSRKTLSHPTEGDKIYPRETIYKKMKMVREMDLYHLLRKKELYFGKGDGFSIPDKNKVH